MKAISLMQPWASLVTHGVKTVETRSWSTKHRGELLIHASGGYMLPSEPLLKRFRKKIPLELPSMAIIGKVNLRDVIKAKDFIRQNEELGFHDLIMDESILGDLSGERFAWLMDEPVIFDEPVPAKGKLCIWEFRQCRVCGCSEQDPCILPNHDTCHWVAPDVCSNCFPGLGLSHPYTRQFSTFIKP